METQFHRSSPKMTICEKLREINDLHQTGSEHDVAVRKLLVEAQVMGKKMSGKLLDYSVDVFKDFWENNPNYLKNLRKRIDCDYLADNSSVAAEKELGLFASKIESVEKHGRHIAEDLISLPSVLGYNKCIVEVGAWMGQASAYIALGIKKSNRHDLKFHCFDRWKATEQMCEEVKNIELKPKENFLHHFEKNIAPFKVKIITHRGAVAKAEWDGQPIELFVFHSGCSRKNAKRMLKIFSPSFSEKTTILWMDYYLVDSEGEKAQVMKWRKRIVDKSDSLCFIKRIEKSKIAVFKYMGGRIIYD